MPDWLSFFPEILKYGATGLSALLFFFAYLLLREQSQKTKSDPKVLKEIRIYMFISVSLAIISLVSSIFCSPTPESSSSPGNYDVAGTVLDETGAVPDGVTINTDYPPATIDEYDGAIVGLEVWRNPSGRLPILTFNADGYLTKYVLLNDHEEQIQNGTIELGEIILKK